MSGYALAAARSAPACRAPTAPSRRHLDALRRAGRRRPRRPRRRQRPRRATASRSSTRPPSRPTTPSARRRASAACASSRAPSCWRELSALQADDRGRRRARQDDDDARWSPTSLRRQPGLRPGLPHRRRAAHAPAATRRGAAGEWLVVEADESDRSMLAPARRRRRGDQRRARPPRDLRLAGGGRAGLPRVPRRAARTRSCGTARSCCAPARRRRVPRRPTSRFDAGGSRFAGAGGGRAAVPGEHNARNAAAALEAAALAGVGRERGRRRAGRRSAGAGRRFERLGATAAGAAGRRRLRPPPDRGRGDDRRRPHARARAGVVAVFQPHLFSRTARAGRGVRRGARAAPTSPVVLDVYPARERAEDFPGVTRPAGRRGGRRRRPGPRGRSGCRGFDDAERVLGAAAARGRPVPGHGRRRRRRARPARSSADAAAGRGGGRGTRARVEPGRRWPHRPRSPPQAAACRAGRPRPARRPHGSPSSPLLRRRPARRGWLWLRDSSLVARPPGHGDRR